jgi:hypothetical protein
MVHACTAVQILFKSTSRTYYFAKQSTQNTETINDCCTKQDFLMSVTVRTGLK